MCTWFQWIYNSAPDLFTVVMRYMLDGLRVHWNMLFVPIFWVVPIDMYALLQAYYVRVVWSRFSSGAHQLWPPSLIPNISLKGKRWLPACLFIPLSRLCAHWLPLTPQFLHPKYIWKLEMGRYITIESPLFLFDMGIYCHFGI